MFYFPSWWLGWLLAHHQPPEKFCNLWPPHWTTSSNYFGSSACLWSAPNTGQLSWTGLFDNIWYQLSSSGPVPRSLGILLNGSDRAMFTLCLAIVAAHMAINLEHLFIVCISFGHVKDNISLTALDNSPLKLTVTIRMELITETLFKAKRGQYGHYYQRTVLHNSC